MDQTTDIQASEELTLPGNHAAASADGLVVDNANDNAGQEEGFEIVLKDDEKPKQDPATNAEFARRRIERKRQRELEQQMEAVKRGELPEHLRGTLSYQNNQTLTIIFPKMHWLSTTMTRAAHWLPSSRQTVNGRSRLWTHEARL